MATALSSMATARKAKKPIIHFGVKGQKKFVSVLCCFLLHIDLFTHSADMLKALQVICTVIRLMVQ